MTERTARAPAGGRWSAAPAVTAPAGTAAGNATGAVAAADIALIPAPRTAESQDADPAVRELSRAGSMRPASILADLVRVAAKALPCDLAVAHCPGVPVQARRGGVSAAPVADPALDALMGALWKQQVRNSSALRAMSAGDVDDGPGPAGRQRRSQDIVPIGGVGLLLLVYGAEPATGSAQRRHALAASLTEITDAHLQRARRDPVTGLANQLGWDEWCGRAQRASRRGEPAGIVLIELSGIRELREIRELRGLPAVPPAPGPVASGAGGQVRLDMDGAGADGGAVLLDLAGDADGTGPGDPAALLTREALTPEARTREAPTPEALTGEAAAELRRTAELVSRAIHPDGLAARTGAGRIAVLLRGADQATTRAVASGLGARLGERWSVGVAWIPPNGSVRAAEDLAGHRLLREGVARARRRPGPVPSAHLRS